jgi:hypothetical protein
LNDPQFYATRAEEAAQLAVDLQTAKSAVAALYSRWEELEAIGR